MVILFSAPTSRVTRFIACPKEAGYIIGGVIHNAYEACISPSQSFKNLKPLPEIFIFKLLLKQLFSKSLVHLGLILKFALKKSSVFENFIGVLNLGICSNHLWI